MAYVNGNRRISPLDINKNVTIGVAFPLDSVNMFKGTQTLKEQVKSNLINLLLTEPGERVNEPNFGVGLKNLLFEQNPDVEVLKEKINTQIEFYIPLITLSDVDANFLEDEHKLFIVISYSFNLDGSSDAIQLNFNSSYFPRGNG
jgi:phage baseplate assembly protein W|tara:strand:- start:403 stop:837 length:435 start_codon:yes stop_codon:yes gene_type:complete